MFAYIFLSTQSKVFTILPPFRSLRNRFGELARGFPRLQAAKAMAGDLDKYQNAAVRTVRRAFWFEAKATFEAMTLDRRWEIDRQHGPDGLGPSRDNTAR